MNFVNVLQVLLFNECRDLCTLTVKEYAEIGASLRYSFEERFQCFNNSKFKTEQAYKTHILRNNCKTIIKNKAAYHKFDNISYKTCFCNFYSPSINQLITIAQNIEKFGTLPTYMMENKMSNKLQQTINIINGYIAEYRKIEMEKQYQSLKK